MKKIILLLLATLTLSFGAGMGTPKVVKKEKNPYLHIIDEVTISTHHKIRTYCVYGQVIFSNGELFKELNKDDGTHLSCDDVKKIKGDKHD